MGQKLVINLVAVAIDLALIPKHQKWGEQSLLEPCFRHTPDKKASVGDLSVPSSGPSMPSPDSLFLNPAISG